MNLIITMAGKYSRFANKGFRVPKFLLPWGDKTILSDILSRMSVGFDNVYLISNKNDIDYMPHVISIMKHNNIPSDNLILIDDTNSQSETAYMGINKIGNIEGHIVFHNIDTILCNRDYDKIRNFLDNTDGYIDVFNSNNHSYSYVIVDDGDKVSEIKEKVLISNIATSGMYGFKNKEMFLKYYKNGYISDIYKRMINDNRSVIIGDRYNESNTIVLGTPEEYLNLSKIILS